LPGSWTSVAVGLYAAGFLILLDKYTAPGSSDKPSQILVWGGSLILVVLWHHSLIFKVLLVQTNDSFYSLSVIQRMGLIAWSMLLITVLFWISFLKSAKILARQVAHNKSLLIAFVTDLVLTLALFVLLYRLSPQIYYIYYQLVVPGLPVQWVLKPGLDLELLFPKLLLQSTKSYSDLLVGLTFWWLIFCTLWRYILMLTGRQWRIWSIFVGAGFGLAHSGWTSINFLN
jgi:hypothetical protein